MPPRWITNQRKKIALSARVRLRQVGRGSGGSKRKGMRASNGEYAPTQFGALISAKVRSCAFFFGGLQRIKQIGRNKRWQSPVLILTKFTNDTAVNGHWETDKLGLTRTGGAEPIWSEPSLCAKEGVVHLWTRRLDLPCAKALYWQRCRQSVVG